MKCGTIDHDASFASKASDLRRGGSDPLDLVEYSKKHYLQ
jgi:hypothetical protein